MSENLTSTSEIPQSPQEQLVYYISNLKETVTPDNVVNKGGKVSVTYTVPSGNSEDESDLIDNSNLLSYTRGKVTSQARDLGLVSIKSNIVKKATDITPKTVTDIYGVGRLNFFR